MVFLFLPPKLQTLNTIKSDNKNVNLKVSGSNILFDPWSMTEFIYLFFLNNDFY